MSVIVHARGICVSTAPSLTLEVSPKCIDKSISYLKLSRKALSLPSNYQRLFSEKQTSHSFQRTEIRVNCTLSSLFFYLASTVTSLHGR